MLVAGFLALLEVQGGCFEKYGVFNSLRDYNDYSSWMPLPALLFIFS
jgi:hypothetical protein